MDAYELLIMTAAAGGDLAILVGLCALRAVENGGPGRELGVLSVPAPTLAAQARVAVTSLRHREAQYVASFSRARTNLGFYTASFLTYFSHLWAPLGASNDPRGLNRHHADNLCDRYAHFEGKLLTGLTTV